MLRGISQIVVYSQRALSRGCLVANGDTFRSIYNLEKLYPDSNVDVTASVVETHHKPVEEFDGNIPVGKLTVKYSCSSGPGGQNVNKVQTKADVRFHVQSADWLPLSIRQSILEKMTNKINNSGELIVTSERTRSQITNFSDCLQKIRDIVNDVQRTPKEPSEKDKAVLRMRVERNNRERLRKKRIHSSIKKDRKVLFE